MKTRPQRSRVKTISLMAVGLLLVSLDASAQQTTVRGRVLYNPMLPDCWQDVPCTREVEVTRPEDWVPPPAAVNVVLQGTDRVVKTNREGYYEITVPSPSATLMFLYIGHNRIAVPVEGRSVVDAKLTPTPLPVVDRLLGLIMPRIHAGEYPNIDQLAADADVNRETARDILWLVLGDLPMARHYPGEFIPDYRFGDGLPRPISQRP